MIHRRKRFNKIVKTLSEIYNKEYKEVLRVYNTMGGNIEETKIILKLQAL